MHNGITNIVANYPDVDEKTNISMMSQVLKECITEGLSQKKWRRFDKSFDAFEEAREAARIAEKEKEKPRYSQTKLQIAVVGAQGRIGATTFAMRLAAYFKSRDGESLVVCANKRGFPQLEMMSEYYGGSEQNGTYTIIRHEPILVVDIQLYRTKILSCRMCPVTCESHIFSTKLTLRIV